MSDSCQAQQRNLYQTKFGHLQYRDGRGLPYKAQLHELSWPIPDDIPAHAQRSSAMAMEEGKYSNLHPNASTVATLEPCFLQTHVSRGSRAMNTLSDPNLPVHERLFVPSKSLSRPASRQASSRPEADADERFAKGDVSGSIRGYTLAISQKPTLVTYEKRCAAWAHVGQYDKALEDAQYILARDDSPAARLRVKNINGFLSTKVSPPLPPLSLPPLAITPCARLAA